MVEHSSDAPSGGTRRPTSHSEGDATGAPGDIATMSVTELRGWLKDHGVTGTSGMRKAELVSTVKTMRSDQATTTGSSIPTGKKSTAGGTATAPTAKKSTTHAKTGSHAGTSSHTEIDSTRSTAGRTEQRSRVDEIAVSGQAIEHEDIIDVLLAHHEQIKALFALVGKAGATHRQETFQQLTRLIAIHETIEQQLVHPMAQRRLPDGPDLIESRVQEEEQATEDLSELYEMGVDHPEFETRLAELRDAVIEHAELEEDEEFGYLREAMPREQLASLASAARAAERIAPASPTQGPPTAIAERVRDALSEALR
ncbi:hemerythrin domain-containing protein [Catellatospora tritici]|uniref:hemerythrin domain-containing protein n=1 Tax=Catellatospora tritici TaxID=2851566 RepID=UPI001C2CCF11|nr:hemerythrin domain-containing protein [Catellatospora tritici]MBV1853150.1 hemerythrin domain-containing protein [Catellatospora tritici]